MSGMTATEIFIVLLQCVVYGGICGGVVGGVVNIYRSIIN